jgi:hypothetical protein
MSAKLWKVGTSNAFSTTLSGGIGSGDSSITLTTTSGLQAPGVLVIDRVDSNGTATPNAREYISFTGISTNTLTGVSRGLGGSSAQAHSSAAVVEEVWSVSHWNDAVDFMAASHDSAGNIVTSAATITTLTTATPKVTTSINDTNSNELIKFTATGSAVNEVTIANSATGNPPTISATGSDTNIGITVTSKGSGNAIITSPTGEVQLTAKTKADVTYGSITDAGNVSSGTTTFNWATTNRHKVTLTGSSATFAMSNQTTGQTMLLEIVQDGTGSRTVSSWTSITWAGGVAPTLTTTASKRDLIGFYYNGSITIGFIVGQNI